MKAKLFLVLVIVTLGISGCDLLKGKEDLNLPTEPVTLSVEDDLVSFERSALEAVKKDGVFLVKVVVTAKQDLELLAVSEVIPPEFVVIGGETTSFLANLSTGDGLELNYSIQAASPKGMFELSGFSRAKPIGEESVQLELVSPIEVR